MSERESLRDESTAAGRALWAKVDRAAAKLPGWLHERVENKHAEFNRAQAFGLGLRELRVDLGIGLREAAALLGTTAVRLGEIERGVASTTESGR